MTKVKFDLRSKLSCVSIADEEEEVRQQHSTFVQRKQLLVSPRRRVGQLLEAKSEGEDPNNPNQLLHV